MNEQRHQCAPGLRSLPALLNPTKLFAYQGFFAGLFLALSYFSLNAQTGGSITIVKESNPSGITGFDFTFDGDLGAFSLDTDPDDGTVEDRFTVGNLPNGDYTIQEVDLPGNWILSDLFCQGGASSIDLDNASVTVTIDEPDQEVTCTFFNNRLGRLEVLKFQDCNSNGIFDEGELPLEGWEISLFNTTTGEQIQQTKTTNADGRTIFTSLDPGTYTVCETLQSGWINPTGAAPVDGQVCQEFAISLGESAAVEFGNIIESDPVITCPEDITVNADPGLCTAVINFEATATDNCDSDPVITFSQDPGTAFNLGVTKVTATATNEFGRTNNCAFDITVNDNQPPAFNESLPANETVTCDNIPVAATLTASDNCDDDATVTFSETRTDGDCPNSYLLIRTWTATDATGNSITHSQSLTVEDKTPPEFVEALPGNQTVACALDIPAPTILTATDNCDDGVEVQFSETTTDQTSPHTFTLTRTWTATDNCDNTTSHTQVITVNDTETPVPNCPGDITVTADQTNCSALVEFTATATDNCTADPAISYSQNPGTAFPEGTTTVTVTATDEAGNSNTCTFDVTVNTPAIAPELPASLTVCDDLAQVTVRVRFTGGQAPYDFVLNDGVSDLNFSTDNAGQAIIQLPTATAAYNLVSVTDANNCVTTITGESFSVSTKSCVIANDQKQTDPCSCNNDETATGTQDGTFGETVAILNTTDSEIWTVVAINPLRPGGSIPAGVAVTNELSFKVGDNRHEISFSHTDDDGYAITMEGPFDQGNINNVTRSISNVCVYPEIALDPELPAEYPNDAVPLPLGVEEVQGRGGNVVFDAGYGPITELDPINLAEGLQGVTATFTGTFADNTGGTLADPAYPGCTTILETPITILPPLQEICACADQINVTLDENCQFELTSVQTGSQDCVGGQIIVDDGVSNGPVVDGAGTFRYVIVNSQGEGVCWGEVNAEDKTAPKKIGFDADPSADSLICTDVELVLNNPETIDPTSKFYLGRPIFVDNCGPVTLSFSDEIEYFDCQTENGQFLFARLTRHFVAEDGGKNSKKEPQQAETSVTYDFFIPQLTAAGLIQTGEIQDCTPTLGELESTLSQAFGITNAFGDEVPLSAITCNYALSFEDDVVEVCEGRSLKVVRTYRIIDWCGVSFPAGRPTEFGQVVGKIGDFEGPVISGPVDTAVVSTGPFECTASFAATESTLNKWGITVEDCPGENPQLNLSVYGWVDELIYGIPTGTKTYRKVAGTSPNGIVTGVPEGIYNLVIEAFDDCYNSTRDSVPFIVKDLIQPVMKCDNQLNVSISANGYARVYAEDIDENSRDNCADQVTLSVRRAVPEACTEEFLLRGYDLNNDGVLNTIDGFSLVNGIWYTPYADYVEFFCCDVGTAITVDLRGQDDARLPFYKYNSNGEVITDDQGAPICYFMDMPNSNSCWTDVMIEDKTIPQCAAPKDVVIECIDPEAAIDLTDTLALQATFGNASIQGPGEIVYCNALVRELAPQVVLDDCGAGYVVRTFQPYNVRSGSSGPVCTQRIDIEEIHRYAIKFPKDAEQICGEPFVDTLEVVEEACDIIAVNVTNDTFFTTADECYKIQRTFTIINWCEYDGFYPEEPWNLYRDFDNNGIPGDKSFWLVRYNDAAEKFPYDYEDYDDDDGDGRGDFIFPEPFDGGAGNEQPDVDLGDEDIYVPLVVWSQDFSNIYTDEPLDALNPIFIDLPDINDKAYWKKTYDPREVGYYRYVQLIKVYDDSRPDIIADTLEVCSFNNNSEAGCPAFVEIPVMISDSCSTGGTLSAQIDAFNSTLDLYALNNDPRYDFNGTVSGSWPNFVISGTFPQGEHTAVVTARDGCGNFRTERIPFSVVDCKAPSPICINGLAIELMPREVVDELGPAAMTIWANDFIASPSFDCNGQQGDTVTNYFIKMVDDKLGLGRDTIDKNRTGLSLYCSDLGSVTVEIYACDTEGNYDFCETYVLVQDNMGNCEDTTIIGEIAGNIHTEEDLGVEGVEVSLSGNREMMYMTDASGVFAFKNLEYGYDYTVRPKRDEDHGNGISTLDIVEIQKHILGVEPLGSPYKILAADANNSGNLSALDLVQIRKIILRVEDRFLENTSWRFVDATYTFPNPDNPWDVPFPEVKNFNDLKGRQLSTDFIAVKIGDVNGSVTFGAGAQPRTGGVFQLRTQNAELQAGASHTVTFSAEEAVQGFQGTIHFDVDQLELINLGEGQAGTEHFGWRYADQGLITISWNGVLDTDAALFSLTFAAKDEVQLKDALRFGSQLTRAEAYGQDGSLMDVQLNIGRTLSVADGFELYQNVPNPVAGNSTWIEFYLPEDGVATLTIADVTGKVVHVVRGEYAAGRNRVRIAHNNLSTGVLTYTLQAGNYQATKRMLVLE